MITKRNTYRPHYFGFGGGDFQEVTEEGNSSMYQQQLNQQGLGQESGGTNWGNVGWGVAGAASGILDQIGKSENNPRGYWDVGDPMHYLANGRTSKAGNALEDTGVAVTKAGMSTGNPWIMLAGAGIKIGGDLVNAGWGMKADKERLEMVNQGIDAANNFQSNAYSFDTLQDPMTLANASNMYEAGWFNKKKTKRKNEELQNEATMAQANVYNQFNNNLSNLQQDQMNNMLANYAAFGGPLHTHGSDWTNGITYVDNGGSHESNPYGGVPMGIAQDGQPNLVEEGEVIYKLDGSPYVYSKRIKMSKELKDKYKFKGNTFADGALEAQKESEERPNDPISQRGLNAIMRDLANEQEKKRAEKAERQAKYAFGGWFEPIDPPKGETQTNIPSTTAVVVPDSLVVNKNLTPYQQAMMQGDMTPLEYTLYQTQQQKANTMVNANQAVNAYINTKYGDRAGEADYNNKYSMGGHKFEDGGHPKKLILKRKGGDRTYTLGDDGMYYTEGMRKGLSWSEIEPYYNKYYFNVDDDSTEPTTVNSDTISTVTESPQQVAGKTLRRIEDADSDYYPGEGSAVNITPLYDYAPVDDWSYWGLNYAYTGNVGNKAFTHDKIEDIVPNTILVTKDANGNPIVPELQTIGEVYDPSKRSRSYTVNQTTEQPVASNTTPVTSVPTSTSKSTSTNKVTGTTSKTTGRQLTDGEKKMQEWLFSNPENFALANKAASEWGARSFKDANDIWNTALTGEPGPAYNGIDEAYRKANRTAWEDLVGRPTFKAEYPTADEEMKSALSNSAERFYNTEEGVEARQKAWERANGAAGDVNNPIDNYRTWMRHAPIFGSGLALALDPWINRPDYTNADLVLEAGKSAGNVDFTPIGDYLSYKPFDRLFYANQLAAQQAATRRALLNTTGGNASTARGLLLAADNQGVNQMGNLWRQAEEYNEANRQAVAEFNRGTNMFNSEGRLKADMANQGQANVRINAAIEAAKLRALEDDRVAETRSANFTNFLDNLGDLGRENLYYNMVNNNNALYYGQNKKGESIYKGEGSTNNPVTMPMPIQQYTKTGKNGGYLTIKKKKR